MRKRIITPSPQDAAAHHEGWLDLDRLAIVEVTSEEKDCPVEFALAVAELGGTLESGCLTSPPYKTRVVIEVVTTFSSFQVS